MKPTCAVATALLCLLLACADALASGPPKGLREVSVTVGIGKDDWGSGTLLVDKQGVAWVLTCDHVFNPDTKAVRLSQHTPSFDGKTKILEVYGEVVKRSKQLDLALVRLGKGVFAKGATLRPGADLDLDAKVFHCGSYHTWLHHSVAGGRVQSIGDTQAAAGQLLDRADITATPGSSGGGMFDRDGRLCGVLVRGMGQRLIWYVPLRVVREWAMREKIMVLLER